MSKSYDTWRALESDPEKLTEVTSYYNECNAIDNIHVNY